MTLLIGDVNPLVCRGLSDVADGIPCRYAERAEEQRCRRRVMSAYALLVISQECNDYIVRFVHRSVIIEIVLGGVLDETCNRFVNIARRERLFVLFDEFLQIFFGFSGYVKIVFVYEFSVCRFLLGVGGCVFHSRKSRNLADERTVIFERIRLKRIAEILGVTALNIVRAVGHRQVVRQEVLHGFGLDLDSVLRDARLFKRTARQIIESEGFHKRFAVFYRITPAFSAVIAEGFYLEIDASRRFGFHAKNDLYIVANLARSAARSVAYTARRVKAAESFDSQRAVYDFDIVIAGDVVAVAVGDLDRNDRCG